MTNREMRGWVVVNASSRAMRTSVCFLPCRFTQRVGKKGRNIRWGRVPLAAGRRSMLHLSWRAESVASRSPAWLSTAYATWAIILYRASATDSAFQAPSRRQRAAVPLLRRQGLRGEASPGDERGNLGPGHLGVQAGD